MELIIVIIVLGILISLALPRYFLALEKARFAEGLMILDVLQGSQIRYKAVNSVYATSASELDASFTNSRYFNIALLDEPHDDDSRYCVFLTRNSMGLPPGWPVGSYSICITGNGEMFCSDMDAGYCAKLGYPSNPCP